MAFFLDKRTIIQADLFPGALQIYNGGVMASEPKFALYFNLYPYGWKGAGKTEWLLWSKTNESKTWKTKLPQNFEGWGRIVELTKEKGRFVCPLNSQKSREVWWETELVPGEFGSEGRIPNIETNYMKRLEEFKGNLYYPGVQAHLEGLALIGFGIYALWGDEYGPFGWTIEETANVAEERKIHGSLVSVYDKDTADKSV